MRRKAKQPRERRARAHVPDAMQLFNQLPEIRARLIDVYLDLGVADLFAVLGEIAVLGALVERAEEFVAQMREERTMAKLRALQDYATERRALTERVQEGEYIPPPEGARSRRRLLPRTP